jgi:hypothetical protein
VVTVARPADELLDGLRRVAWDFDAKWRLDQSGHVASMTGGHAEVGFHTPNCYKGSVSL